jgi:hypothetical protein
LLSAQEGIRGFYGGYGTVFMFSMPTNAVYFASYSAFKRDYRNRFGDNSASDLAAGFSAQICASVLWTPFDVVKQRLQVQNQNARGAEGVFGMIRQIAAKDGWIALYRGIFAGWAVWCPFSAIYFATFERVNEKLLSMQPSPEVTKQRRFGLDLLSGMTAGAIGGVLTQPLDALKTRLQVSTQQGGTLTILSLLNKMLKEEGVLPLYRGVWGRVLWLAPGTGITIAVFSMVQANLAPGV